MKTVKSIVAFVAIALAVSSAYGTSLDVVIGSAGNNASFGGSFSDAAPAAVAADPNLAPGSIVFDLSVTTQSDILLFDAEIVSAAGMNQPGGWFNEVTNGNDTNPPNPTFVNFIPGLGADSYLTTPDAGTAAAGANTFDGAAGARLVTHSDSIDSGPQTDFNFARITLIPDGEGNAEVMFRGTLQTSASPTPIFDDFEYMLTVGEVVPEPSSIALMLSAALIGLGVLRRRS